METLSLSGVGAYFCRIAAGLVEIEDLIETTKTQLNERIAKSAIEPAIGKQAAAKVLGCCVSTLEKRLTKPNPPPHYKDGKVLFYESELRQWRSAYRIGLIPKTPALSQVNRGEVGK